ncbi:hypothetical protein [Alkaliphilus transvaalensis]|uniref:hypothetical protein n=1 Tax=Alkaliphilus transvaalensis TaxID=114628 RepID=UPI000478A96D|nr:hypothetical protein [Alkaliphilus transvaalensis]
MSAINFSLKFSSFNININIKKDLNKYSKKLDQLVKKEASLQQALDAREQILLQYHKTFLQ